MQLTPEIKAQLEEQKKQCVFCKINSGEIPGKKVFEDDKTVAFLDINPAVKGHILFMLKEHYPLPAYIPGDEFGHMFSLIPNLSKSIKSAILKTGINAFMAIGEAAGQQVGHFAVHLMPRENGDGFFNFLFNKFKGKTEKKEIEMLSQNLPIMMKNHFGRNPASWHTGKGDFIPNYLSTIYESNEVIYEDEKVLCISPQKSLTKGHLIIYSKTEEKYVEKLSAEDSSHLFFTASFASTAVFEGLGAHATNILLKSGESDDNVSGLLEVHILPRWQDDNLKKINWQPKQPSYDLDSVAKKIKDKTWGVCSRKKDSSKRSKTEVNQPVVPEVIKIKTNSKQEKSSPYQSYEDEIKKAIEDLKN